MKSIFTYPNNAGTDYIDPNYVGDATSGFYKRVDELRTGTYRAWLGQNPIATGSNTNLIMSNVSKFYNALKENWGEVTFYKMWEQPVIVKDTELIQSSISDAQVGNLVDVTINFSGNHGFYEDQLMQLSGFDGSLSELNGQEFYVNKIDADTVKLTKTTGGLPIQLYQGFQGDITSIQNASAATGASVINIVMASGTIDNGDSITFDNVNGSWAPILNGNTFYAEVLGANQIRLHDNALLNNEIAVYDLANGFITSSVAGSPVVFNHSALPFTEDMLVNVGSFDGTFGDRYNGQNLYIQNYTGTTFNLSTDQAGTNLIDFPLNALNQSFGDFELVSNDTMKIEYVLDPDVVDGSQFDFNSDELITNFTDDGVDYQINNASRDGNRLFLRHETNYTFIERVYNAQTRSWTTDTASNINTIIEDVGSATNISGVNLDGTVIAVRYAGSGGNIKVYKKTGNTWAKFSTISPATAQYRTAVGIPYVAWPYTLIPGFTKTLLSDDGTRLIVSTGDDYFYTFNDSPNATRDVGNAQDISADGDWVVMREGDQIRRSQYNVTTEQYDLVDIVDYVNGSGYDIANYITMTSDASAITYTMTTTGTNQPEPVFYWDTTNGGREVTEMGSHYLNEDLAIMDDKTLVFKNGSNQSVQFWVKDAVTSNFTLSYTSPALGAFAYSLDPAVSRAGAFVKYVVRYSDLELSAYRTLLTPMMYYISQHIINTYGGTLYSKQTGTNNILELYTDAGLTTPATWQSNPILATGVYSSGLATVDITFNWINSTTGYVVEVDQTGANYTAIDYPVATTQGDFWEGGVTLGDNVIGIIGDPNIASTTGTLTISTSESARYRLTAGQPFIVLPGNTTYMQRTGESTYVPNALVHTSYAWCEEANGGVIRNYGISPAPFAVNTDANGRILSTTAIDTEFPGAINEAESVMFAFYTAADTYVAPIQSPAEQQDNWDMDTEWDSNGFNTAKEWPHEVNGGVTPRSAKITYNQPNSVTVAQNGTKYVRNLGFQKWQLEVEYPPLTEEEFRLLHVTAQNARGQFTPFYFVNRDSVGNALVLDYHNTLATTQARVKEIAFAGEREILLEGYPSFQNEAVRKGELALFGDGTANGAVHTMMTDVNSNAYGEARIKIPYGLTNNAFAGQDMYFSPYHFIVTLADDGFEYDIDTAGFYYVRVTFDFDEWK